MRGVTGALGLAASALGLALTALAWRRRQHLDAPLAASLLRGAPPGGSPAANGRSTPVVAVKAPHLPRTVPVEPSLTGAKALTQATCALIGNSMPIWREGQGAALLYDELFRLMPELRFMPELGGSVPEQQSKLIAALEWLGACIKEKEKDTNFALCFKLREMGARHVKHGLRLHHFQPLKRAFLQMIQVVDQQTIEARRDEERADEGEVDGESDPPPIDHLQRLLEVSRSWEALLYVIVGECSVDMLMLEDLKSFHAALKNELAAPAGGTCTALSGAQGASLLVMSAELTRAYSPGSPERALVDKARTLLCDAAVALEALARMDMQAYCKVMAAVHQPPLSAPAERTRAIQHSLHDAASVPLQVAEWATHSLRVAQTLVPLAARSGVGDAGAGVLLLVACGRCAVQNCEINTRQKNARDCVWRAPVEARARALKREIAALDVALHQAVERRLKA
ncbi:Formiminotransferase-cyclodeaminase-domain-containing protein [Pavlovales sp. CCMP2436]|nr:Formiminotransferase-cyclodeaminase-domain-containing protein [Pavlovales sp. CCMP2436]